MNRKIMQLEIEREAIKRESDTAKLAKLNEEIANLIEKRNALNAQWENEKGVLSQIQQKKATIEALKIEADQAERDGNYGRVAEIRYGLIKKNEEDLFSLSLKLGDAVLKQIGGFAKLHKPQVEQASFAVLKAPDVPSILIETAFISNPDEEVRLRNPAYQAQLSDALMRGILRYFAKNPPLARNRAI